MIKAARRSLAPSLSLANARGAPEENVRRDVRRERRAAAAALPGLRFAGGHKRNTMPPVRGEPAIWIGGVEQGAERVFWRPRAGDGVPFDPQCADVRRQHAALDPFRRGIWTFRRDERRGAVSARRKHTL